MQNRMSYSNMRRIKTSCYFTLIVFKTERFTSFLNRLRGMSSNLLKFKKNKNIGRVECYNLQGIYFHCIASFRSICLLNTQLTSSRFRGSCLKIRSRVLRTQIPRSCRQSCNKRRVQTSSE